MSFIGTVGTASDVVESDYQAGIKNTALYLHDGGKVALTGSETKCWTKLQFCTEGMTLSIWFKPITLAHSDHQYVVGSSANKQEGFSIYMWGPSKAVLMIVYTSIGRYGAESISRVCAQNVERRFSQVKICR